MTTHHVQSEPFSAAANGCGAISAAAHWLALLERLAGCYRRMRAELAECTRDHGISDGEFLLLWLCDCAMPGGLDQSELSSRAAISPANVSGRVEGLRRSGFLEASRDESDRRRQVWHVTPRGKEVLGRILSELEPRTSGYATEHAGQPPSAACAGGDR